MSAQHLSPPQPVQLSKRGSLTPSIVRLLTRYPPAIMEDNPIPETPQSQTEQVIPESETPFERRFPQGYKVADSSIPLHPDEVPAGYENLFSPSYYPICRRCLIWGLIFPPLWAVGGGILLLRRIGLSSIIDPKVYWTRVQWLKLNTKAGVSSGLAFIVLLLIVIVVVMVLKNYITR